MPTKTHQDAHGLYRNPHQFGSSSSTECWFSSSYLNSPFRNTQLFKTTLGRASKTSSAGKFTPTRWESPQPCVTGKSVFPPLETVPNSNERFRHLGACNSFSFVCPSCNAVKSPAYFEQKSIRRHPAGCKVSIPLCLCRCIINRPDVNPSPTLSSIPSLKLKCTKVM